MEVQFFSNEILGCPSALHFRSNEREEIEDYLQISTLSQSQQKLLLLLGQQTSHSGIQLDHFTKNNKWKECD